MRDNYINLETIKYGKHEYVILKNNDKILYFELINGKYEMPVISFDLYDNEGKSLTSVNQHFFMNQLVNKLNISCKKGIFISNDEIIDYLKELKSKTESDLELKKLFKGALMAEIDEKNFEENKKEILKYLDKYKFDTFVDYNNVAIFNGTLEKNTAEKEDIGEINIDKNQPTTKENDSNNDVSKEENKEIIKQPISQNTIQESKIDTQIPITTTPEINPQTVPNNSLGQTANIANNTIPNTNTSEQLTQIFQNNVQEQSKPIQPTQSNVQEQIKQIQPVQNNIQTQNQPVQNKPIGTQQNTKSQEQSSTESSTMTAEQLFKKYENKNSDIDQTVRIPIMENKPIKVQNNEPSDPEDVIMENKSYDAATLSINTPFELLNDINASKNSQKQFLPQEFESIINSISSKANNTVNKIEINKENSNQSRENKFSYLDEVKNRIENNKTAQTTNQLVQSTMNAEQEIISDKNELPDIDYIEDDEEETIEENKFDKKIIIFFIILTILLVLFTYLIYNYVF